MSIAADGAAAVTGVVSNVCTDPSAAGKDLSIVGKSGIAANVAKVASSGNVLLTNDLTLTDSSFPTPSGDSVAAQRITKSIRRSTTKSIARSSTRSAARTRTASFAEAAAEHVNQNNAWNGSNAHVGNGGSAQLRDLAGNLIGHGGNGSITSGLNGNGGIGWSGCGTTPPSAGGPGGPGGSAAGRDGTGGSGVVRGLNGTTTFTTAVNGGNGGDGKDPGAGGIAGIDSTTSLRPKTLNPPDFMNGNPGRGCPTSSARTEAVEIVVQSDPNAEEPYVRYTSVQQVTIVGGGSTPGATSTIMIQGSAPCVTVSGVFGGATFMATGSGTVGGYPNISVTFTGSMSSLGLISGTIQIALPSGTVKYTLSPKG